jgi:hypothetical protein
LKIKRIIFFKLSFSAVFAANGSHAEKPIDEWTKLDVMKYFQANNIVKENLRILQMSNI